MGLICCPDQGAEGLHSISNEFLTLTVREQGAELYRLCRKGEPDWEVLWDGQLLWPWRAPICFPWTGKIEDDWYEEEGIRYIAPVHGFGRLLRHELIAVNQELPKLSFRLTDNEDNRRYYPWPFQLDTTHALEGRAVVSTCTIINTGEKAMPVRFGFHTAVRCPLEKEYSPADYQLRFDLPENPIEVICQKGLSTGETQSLPDVRLPAARGQQIIPLNQSMFDNDSICLKNIRSSWIQLERINDTYQNQPALRMYLEGFDRLVLWSKPGIPGFLCIEPWNGEPGLADGKHSLWNQFGVRVLKPGEQWVNQQRLECR